MFGLFIDPNSSGSYTRQLCDQLRRLIEEAQLQSGERLPPTRNLADELKISRNIIIEVYEQLAAEGYLESKIGSGTYVASINKPDVTSHSPLIAKAKENLNSTSTNIVDFTGGHPDLGLFPRKLWGKYLKQATDTISDTDLGYGDIQGDSELILALKDYLFRMKGIRASTNQLIIVSGSSEAFLLLAKVFHTTLSEIVVEEPTASFTKDIFSTMNFTLVPAEVDHYGMQVASLGASDAAKLILLTPSHQFPTGSVLSIQRRHQIIAWAEKTNSYILEDDYDSEFRLKGVPIPPLQILAPNRVFHVGTFSKILSPALRLGFLIVPEHFIDTACEIKGKLNFHTSILEQKALALMIADGHLERHIYTMKKTYRKKRSFLITCLKERFKDTLEILGDDAGMHLQVQLTNLKNTTLDWAKSIAYGIAVNSLDDYRLVKGKHTHKILLGYGDLTPREIALGVTRLQEFVQSQLDR